MAAPSAAWRQVPLPLRAIALGILAAAAGTLPWAGLAYENLHHLRAVPWAPVVMGGYLWLYWRYTTGHGWPAATSRARRETARVRPIHDSLWGMAIVAGILGLWFSVSLLHLIGRLVVIPAESPGDLSGISPLSLFLFAVMTGCVAGVVEEISFRGYMQRPLEKRYGPTAAILVVGVTFGLAHASHSFWSLALMPYYMSVAAVFGGLAYLTDSVLPSMILHGAGDTLDALFALAGGGAVGMPVSQEQGPAGVGLAINVAVLIGTGVATVWAFRELARAARTTGSSQTRGIA